MLGTNILQEGYLGELHFSLNASQGRVLYIKPDQKIYFGLYVKPQLVKICVITRVRDEVHNKVRVSRSDPAARIGKLGWVSVGDGGALILKVCVPENCSTGTFF